MDRGHHLIVCLCGTQADRQAESWQRLPFFQNKGFTMCHKRVQTQCLECDGLEFWVRVKLKDPVFRVSNNG
jgi:hypothetical protein